MRPFASRALSALTHPLRLSTLPPTRFLSLPRPRPLLRTLPALPSQPRKYTTDNSNNSDTNTNNNEHNTNGNRTPKTKKAKQGKGYEVDLSPLTDAPPNSSATDAQNAEQNRLRRAQEPAYHIVFTCRPCGHRSAHRMSKHGYHRGTVLIKCPSCENRHVMSDHLKIFFDKGTTVEDILKENGGKVARGYLEGDMEFWDDGSVTRPGDENGSGYENPQKGERGQGEEDKKLG